MSSLIPQTLAEAINRPIELLSTAPTRCIVHEVKPIQHPTYNTAITFRVYPKGVDVTTDDISRKPYRLKKAMCNRVELTLAQLATAYYVAAVPNIDAIVARLNMLYAGGLVIPSDFDPVPFDLTGAPGTRRQVNVKTSRTSLYYYGSTMLEYEVPYPVPVYTVSASYAAGTLTYTGGKLYEGGSSPDLGGLWADGFCDVTFTVPGDSTFLAVYVDNRPTFAGLGINSNMLAATLTGAQGNKQIVFGGVGGGTMSSVPVVPGDVVVCKFGSRYMTVSVNGQPYVLAIDAPSTVPMTTPHTRVVTGASVDVVISPSTFEMPGQT